MGAAFAGIHTVHKTATAHMTINLLMVGLYAAAAFTFWSSESAGNMTLPFALQFCGFALMMAAGFLGGEMVFKHKLGVVEDKGASKP